MRTKLDYTLSAIGLPDQGLNKIEQGKQLANRAFRLLYDEMIYVDTQQGLVDVWRLLVLAIQNHRPEWVCEGPYRVKDGALVFKGTMGYLMVFTLEGPVFLGKTQKIFPAPDWEPRLSKMITLREFLNKLNEAGR